MKQASAKARRNAGAVVAACAALAIGYPMLARQDGQPQPAKPVEPAKPASADPAPKPTDETKPAGTTTASSTPAAEGAKQPEKPAEPPTDTPAATPTDAGGIPAPLTDEAIAKMDADTAMKEWTARKKAATKPDLDPAVKQRLLDEAEKAKVRMEAAKGTTPAPASNGNGNGKTTKPRELPPRDAKTGRVIQPDENVPLTFKATTVEQIIPFIVEATGKVVIPRPDLLPRKITIINDQPIKRSRALDMVFYALQQEGIGIIETRDVILMRNIAELPSSDVPVIGPDEDLAGRDDYGTVIQKVFALEYASAANIVQGLEDAKTMPDYSKILLDADSNHIVVMANIGLLQRVEAIIKALDKPATSEVETKTFRLKYADAEKIATSIRDLYSANATQGNQNQNNPNFGFRNFGQEQNQGGRRRNQTGSGATALSQNLRANANTQQNSVTVLAEPKVLEQIETQINEEWDRPLPVDTVIPKVFEIKNTDVIKLKTALEEMFGKTGTSATSTGGGNQGGGNQRNFGGDGGGAASSGTSQGANRLAGQFAFTALTDSNRLAVIAKSPDNMEAVEKIIAELDKPKSTGIPTIIELKHASAEELAEQLNAMIAKEGTRATIPRQASGLTMTDSNASPFSTSTDTAANTNTANTNTNTSNQTIQFWWERDRPPTDNAGTSNIVSKVRIVPVWRQNALMVMCPAEYQQGLLELVEKLDKPGRQVLISAIIVELSLDDSTALGLRWSSSNIIPTNGENSISVGNAVTGTKNELINSLFDTSVLNTNVNLNVLLQALAQKTTTNILSEPRIFTSDNQEATFFDGQDIPFVNELQTNNNGNPTQSFDYRAVGIQLTVRPRITIKRDVDLNINLELASVSPAQTVQNALIVDRRETTTHLIVKDGQTVVLSGIMRNETSKINRKVPILGDLPLIGAIFNSIENRVTNTELIAFITPIVVENTEDADKLYEKDRNRLEDMREKEFGEKKGRELPKSLEEGGERPEDPSAHPDLDGKKPTTPPADGSMGGISAPVPEPLVFADIVTMDEDKALAEANRRESAATRSGLDVATRNRLLDESTKCRERVQIARQQTTVRIPAPIDDSIIAALDVEGAMKEWKARSAAAQRDSIDTATKSRLSLEAEKCRLRMIAASGG